MQKFEVGFMMKQCVRIGAVFSAVVLFMSTGSRAFGSLESFSGSSGDLSAQVDFSLSGSTLTITLINTSLSEVSVPTDVLTGVFFDTTQTLTPVSASLDGSSVYYGTITSGSSSEVGNGWGYASGVSAHGENSAISASGPVNGLGFSNFGNTPTQLKGLGYGLLSAGGVSATVNKGVTMHGPLIQNQVQFTLTAAAGFTLSDLGDSVVFQYGTALADGAVGGSSPATAVPAPSTALVGALLLLPSGIGLIRGLRKGTTRLKAVAFYVS